MSVSLCAVPGLQDHQTVSGVMSYGHRPGLLTSMGLIVQDVVKKAPGILRGA